MTTNTPTVHVAIPADLHRKAKEIAKAERRSLASLVVLALEALVKGRANG